MKEKTDDEVFEAVKKLADSLLALDSGSGEGMLLTEACERFHAVQETLDDIKSAAEDRRFD